jgi:hypothetical protein
MSLFGSTGRPFQTRWKVSAAATSEGKAFWWVSEVSGVGGLHEPAENRVT